MKEINNLKKDDLFKVSLKSKTVYIFKGYNRSTRKYCAYKWEDISSFREWKKGKLIFVNFEF